MASVSPQALDEFLASRPEAKVVFCFINGLGDGLLARPVILRSAERYGLSRVVVWAPDDVLGTVLSGLPCTLVPIQVDRDAAALFVDAASAVASIVRELCEASTIAWVGLNAYYPLWPLEMTARQLVRPERIWDFGVQPESFRFSADGALVPMRNQLLAVVGDASPSRPEERLPQMIDSAITAARSHIRQHLGSLPAFLVVHTDTVSEKEWTIAGWEQLCRAALTEYGWPAVAVGCPPPELLATGWVVPAPDGWSIHAALVRLARAFVGVDSCFAHLADALGTPGVVLFGPSCPGEWGPQGSRLTAMRVPSGCLDMLDPDIVLRCLGEAVAATVAPKMTEFVEI